MTTTPPPPADLLTTEEDLDREYLVQVERRRIADQDARQVVQECHDSLLEGAGIATVLLLTLLEIGVWVRWW